MLGHGGNGCKQTAAGDDNASGYEKNDRYRQRSDLPNDDAS